MIGCKLYNTGEEEEARGPQADQGVEAGHQEYTRLTTDEPSLPTRRQVKVITW